MMTYTTKECSYKTGGTRSYELTQQNFDSPHVMAATRGHVCLCSGHEIGLPAKLLRWFPRPGHSSRIGAVIRRAYHHAQKLVGRLCAIMVSELPVGLSTSLKRLKTHQPQGRI